MSFQRTNKVDFSTQMVEQYSRHGVRVTELTPSQRCSLMLFFILSYSLTMTFAFQFYLAAPLSIFLAIFTAFLLVYILPALSSHIFIKSNQSNSTNHQGPPGENDLEAAGNLSQRTLESPMRCSPDFSTEPDSGSGPTLTTDLPPPSTGQDADTATRDLPPDYEEVEHLDLPTYSTLELENK